MGLDYSFVIVINAGQEDALLAIMQQTEGISLYPDNCMVIDVKLDEHINEYLKVSIRQTEELSLLQWLAIKKSKFTDYFPADGMGRIGCIYTGNFKNTATNQTFAQFTAATTSMSVLFSESSSLRQWFINIAKQVNAKAVFIDCEDQNYIFIYDGDSEIDLHINSYSAHDVATNSESLRNICVSYETITQPWKHDEA